MATYPAQTVLWRMIFHQRLHNQEVQNVFHFVNKLDIDSDDDLIFRTADLCDEFFTRAVATWGLVQSQEVSFIKITSGTLIPRFGPQAERLIEVGGGAVAGESLPSYCAGIISVRTGLSGASRRGRLYIAGVPEDFSQGGQMETFLFDDYVGLCAVLFNNFHHTGSDPMNEWVLYSRRLGVIDGIATFNGVFRLQQVFPRRILGTQRHRLVGHGN